MLGIPVSYHESGKIRLAFYDCGMTEKYIFFTSVAIVLLFLSGFIA
jgi:hypothetical protein